MTSKTLETDDDESETNNANVNNYLDSADDDESETNNANVNN